MTYMYQFNSVLNDRPPEGFGMANAVEIARDAIGLKGIVREDEGLSLPEPSAMDKIDLSKGTFAEDGRGFLSLVDIDFAEYRRKR